MEKNVVSPTFLRVKLFWAENGLFEIDG